MPTQSKKYDLESIMNFWVDGRVSADTLNEKKGLIRLQFLTQIISFYMGSFSMKNCGHNYVAEDIEIRCSDARIFAHSQPKHYLLHLPR